MPRYLIVLCPACFGVSVARSQVRRKACPYCGTRFVLRPKKAPSRVLMYASYDDHMFARMQAERLNKEVGGPRLELRRSYRPPRGRPAKRALPRPEDSLVVMVPKLTRETLGGWLAATLLDSMNMQLAKEKPELAGLLDRVSVLSSLFTATVELPPDLQKDAESAFYASLPLSLHAIERLAVERARKMMEARKRDDRWP